MRVPRRQLTIGLVSVLLLTGLGTPAVAAPPAPAGAEVNVPGPAVGAEPVALLVGLRPGVERQAPADRLADGTDIDVVDSAPVPGTNAVTVEVAASEAADAAAVLARDPAVTYVEPDRLAHTDAVAAADPYRRAQWGTNVAGVSAAWRRTIGSADVTVAVVDTGVSPVSDLAGALLPGKDLVNDDADATDDNGHGTQTATVLAGRGNNGVAGAGVCWKCRILPVKALGANGFGAYSDIAEGIVWAADQGAHIINLSLGGSYDSQVLRDAVGYAVARGALVVAAAGNAGNQAMHFPAAIPAVLAVGGSTATDARYDWSTYGSGWVDIAAPGCNQAQTRDGAVREFCGTSSATPFLAGVAALAKSVRPAATATQLRAMLTGTATGMRTRWVASGRVNAAALVDARAPTLSVRSPGTGSAVRGRVTVGVNATDDTAVQRVEVLVGNRVVATDRSAPWAPVWVSGHYNGPATLRVRAYDLAGRATVAARQVTVDNTAPTLQVVRAPGNGARRVRGTVYVAAVAADRSGVNRVELLVNGRPVARDTMAGYTFGVPTWKYGSTMRVQLRAYDRVGNVRYTTARTWYR